MHRLYDIRSLVEGGEGVCRGGEWMWMCHSHDEERGLWGETVDSGDQTKGPPAALSFWFFQRPVGGGSGALSR